MLRTGVLFLFVCYKWKTFMNNFYIYFSIILVNIQLLNTWYLSLKAKQFPIISLHLWPTLSVEIEFSIFTKVKKCVKLSLLDYLLFLNSFSSKNMKPKSFLEWRMINVRYKIYDFFEIVYPKYVNEKLKTKCHLKKVKDIILTFTY